MNEVKQITETYAVRLDPKIKVELEDLIREYKVKGQGTKGDFIKLLVETFKTNNLTHGVDGIEADIKELNTLTTRMYSLYSNLIEKSNVSIESLRSESSRSNQASNDIINELKGTIEELKKKNIDLNKLNEKLSLEVEELKERISKDNILIHKLTEEADNIKALRLDCDAEKQKAKDLEKSLNLMSIANKELQETININQSKLDVSNESLLEIQLKYQKELEYEKKKHQEELDNKIIENQREIDIIKHSLESKFINETLKLKENHQDEITAFQNKNYKNREEAQDKYIERLERMEAEKEDLKKYIEELKNRLDSKT